MSTRWWLLVDHGVLRNWDRILVGAVKELISRAGMVSICPLLWQRDVKLQQTYKLKAFLPLFLAPPAERQRSFSNADSSVVRRPSSVVRRPSSVVRRPSSTFQLKAWFLKNCLIAFFLFWHVASLGWYQCIVKIWIWLNHPKGHFERSERSNLAPFLLGGNFLKNCLITFSLFMQ